MRSVYKGLLVSLATFGLLCGLFATIELLFRRFGTSEPGLDGGHLELMLWGDGPCYRVTGSGGNRELVELQSPYPSLSREGKAPPERFPLARRLGVKRVVVIGESSAAMMEAALAGSVKHPSCAGRYEVLKCAVPGGDLRQIERRFEYALDYNPDAVIVMFGHNLFFSNPSDPLVARVQLLRSRSRFLSYLTRRLYPYAPGPSPAEALSSLERALHHFADEAAKRHVTLVLSTMASNLWFHPTASVNGEDENRTGWFEALLQDDLGHHDEAIAVLRRLADEHPSAIVEFQLADWLYQRGDYVEARQRFERARDLDSVRSRASTAVNELIRAAAHPPVVLHDTERAISAAAPHGIPGWESFKDNCHLRPETLNTEALALLATVGDGEACADGRSAPADEMNAPWLGASSLTEDSGLYGTFVSSLDTILEQASAVPTGRAAAWWADLACLVADALDRLGPRVTSWLQEYLTKGRFTQVDPARQSEVLAGVAEGFWRAGRRESAREFNERARTLLPAPTAWVQRGRWDLRLGQQAEALAAFETAVQAAPTRGDASYFVERLKTLAAGQ